MYRQQRTHATEEIGKSIREEIRTIYQSISSLENDETARREYRCEAGRLLDSFLSKLVTFQRQQREMIDRQRGSLVRARSGRSSLRMERTTYHTTPRKSYAGLVNVSPSPHPTLTPPFLK